MSIKGTANGLYLVKLPDTPKPTSARQTMSVQVLGEKALNIPKKAIIIDEYKKPARLPYLSLKYPQNNAPGSSPANTAEVIPAC